jgi:hypothetical protein
MSTLIMKMPVLNFTYANSTLIDIIEGEEEEFASLISAPGSLVAAIDTEHACGRAEEHGALWHHGLPLLAAHPGGVAGPVPRDGHRLCYTAYGIRPGFEPGHRPDSDDHFIDLDLRQCQLRDNP